MKAAKELARIYGENEEEAEFAGLIHDIAKEMKKEEIENYLQEYKIYADEIEKNQMSLLHSKIGASIAKEEYGANDKICDAIKYHTTGSLKMDTFAKIIFVADKIEESRDYEGVKERRIIAKENLDQVILDVLDDTIKKSIRTSTLIHPDSISVRNKILCEQNITI